MTETQRLLIRARTRAAELQKWCDQALDQINEQDWPAVARSIDSGLVRLKPIELDLLSCAIINARSIKPSHDGNEPQ